eukprot:TRINITY_DN5877_c0_g1_i1.p1 TRINITY_DN5877_c0_g1~~TRINITY_DN5877_c0_g1_i1.p1  ORF type:complete len:504 (-),score=103.75 TRINITY_DN5877_c0_g1_i1:50-1561(-)
MAAWNNQPIEDDYEVYDNEGVAEHLHGAVEGTLRLKRLLSDDLQASLDEDKGVATKRRRLQDQRQVGWEESKKIDYILRKWGLSGNTVVRHVLEGCSMEELWELDVSQYYPDTTNEWRGPAELSAVHVAQMREQKGPSGGSLDLIQAFRAVWKLDGTQEARLRLLSHKDVRYVLGTYDGTKPLDQVMEEAKRCPPLKGLAVGAAPSFVSGSKAVGRFHRLELIDPTADAAVFGDANLTFALNLAKHRQALGHVGRVIATTFENLETLQERYTEIDGTIKILDGFLADVYHEVDCTRIAVDPRFKNMEGTLGAVYYNFPHAGAAWVDIQPGQGHVTGFYDSHPIVNWRHENLMRLFFRNLRYFVKPGGSVKVASNMGAVGVRYSYILGSAAQNEFTHVETVPFLEWSLHRYGRAYGDRRDKKKRPGDGQGYNAQKAESDMVYTFEYRPTGRVMPDQEIRLPPTLACIQGCNDGPFKNLDVGSAKVLARQLHERFIKECSGIHVG